MSNSMAFRAGLADVDVSAIVEPEDPERAARLERAAVDAEFFARTYFPHYFSADDCDFHRELRGLLFDSTDDLVLAAPRDHAKSTVCSFLYPLREVLFGRRHYVVILRKTMTDAEEAMDAIRHELESNELLRGDFGDLLEMGKGRALRLSTDALIVGKTRGSKVRGTRFRQYRPDLVIADDLEDDEHIESQLQREKDEKWFNSAIVNACGPGGRMVVIGTILHGQSLLATLLANSSYTTRTFRAVIDWPERSDLWDEWRSIYQARERGKDAALRFFRRHRKKMLAGVRVLWPARKDFYSLMLLREKIGSLSFEQELQNNPLDPESQLVLEDWIQFYEPVDLVNIGLTFFGALDPSVGRRQGNDPASIISVAVGSDGRIYVWDDDTSRRSVLAMVAAVFRHESELRYSQFGVETVAFQAALIEIIQREGQRRGQFLPVVELRPAADKRTRFAGVAPLIENGTIRFRRSQYRLIEELIGFPRWEHDDRFDALEMAVQLARGIRDGLGECFGGRKLAVAEAEVW